MTLLLDTQVASWVSVWVSVWEIAIKHALGGGDMPVPGKDAVNRCLASGHLKTRSPAG